MPTDHGVVITFPPDIMRPLITQIVAEVFAAQDQDRDLLSERLAFSEAEAASLLGLATHQLRDERRRGRIGASLGPGRRILYSRRDLIDYLNSRRWGSSRNETTK